jgi:hypothetical protein
MIGTYDPISCQWVTRYRGFGKNPDIGFCKVPDGGAATKIVAFAPTCLGHGSGFNGKTPPGRGRPGGASGHGYIMAYYSRPLEIANAFTIVQIRSSFILEGISLPKIPYLNSKVFTIVTSILNYPF